MRIFEITEARKNPDQNPKISINSVLNRIMVNTHSSVARVRNAFVSYTKVDKLGINPQSEWDTPIGIYAYPLRWIIDTIGSKKSSTEIFAGDSPFVNVFKAQGNIVNVAIMQEDEAKKYYQKIIDFWAKSSGEPKEAIAQEVQQYINESRKEALIPDYAGGRFWYVTMKVSERAAELNNSKPHIAWNALFRGIGIDGVIDYDSDEEDGLGIIHENEPAQAVFFTTSAVSNVQRFRNLYAPDSMERRKKYGQGVHSTISELVTKLRSITDPEEAYNLVEKDGFEHLPLVKNSEFREYILSRNPQTIGYLRAPTAREQEVALTVDMYNALPKIKSPDQSIVAKSLLANPGSYQVKAVMNKFQNPSEELQRVIVSINPKLLIDFDTTYKSVVQTAIDKMGKDLPTWLVSLAKQHNIVL